MKNKSIILQKAMYKLRALAENENTRPLTAWQAAKAAFKIEEKLKTMTYIEMRNHFEGDSGAE